MAISRKIVPRQPNPFQRKNVGCVTWYLPASTSYILMRDDASNRPRLTPDAGHPQTRGFRTPTLSSHEASLASPHHLHLPVKNLPASNKKPFSERLASFILSNITSINQLKHTTAMASSDSEEVDEDSSLASTEHVFKIWHVWRANFSCLNAFVIRTTTFKMVAIILASAMAPEITRLVNDVYAQAGASLHPSAGGTFSTPPISLKLGIVKAVKSTALPHTPLELTWRKVSWARTVDTNPPFKSPSAFLPSASVLAPFEEPGDIDNHPGPPSAGHDMREGWREMTNTKICRLEKMNNTHLCTCCSAGILLV